jgi:hypothetical protein
MSQGDTPQEAVDMVLDALNELSKESFDREIGLKVKDVGINSFTLDLVHDEELPFVLSLATTRRSGGVPSL